MFEWWPQSIHKTNYICICNGKHCSDNTSSKCFLISLQKVEHIRTIYVSEMLPTAHVAGDSFHLCSRDHKLFEYLKFDPQNIGILIREDHALYFVYVPLPLRPGLAGSLSIPVRRKDTITNKNLAPQGKKDFTSSIY